MKTPSTLKRSVLAVFALTIVTTAHAGTWSKPDPIQSITQSLEKQVLSDEVVADLVKDRKTVVRPVSDLEIVTRIGINPPISNEGIPPLARVEIPIDVMPGVDDSVELIEAALKDRTQEQMGARIDYLMNQAAGIIEFSGEKGSEVLMRLTLNRAVDMINHVRPIAGLNPDYLARLMANFMRTRFQVAASYANNRAGVTSVIYTTPDTQAPVARKVSLADFGRVHAEAMLRLAQDPTITREARAVVLMRTLGYMGWDFNADLLRREPPLARTITEIYRLQTSTLYRRILAAIANNQAPASQDVSTLLDATATIVESLPERLQKAGILKY